MIRNIIYIICLLFCFTTQVAAEQKLPYLSVKENQLVNSEGTSVQLKGISTHGIAWFPEYINEECFKELKSWGVNVIRIAMYTEESGGYCTDGNKEQLKDLINKGVEYATKYDMYVIIDWHILSDGNPNKHIEQAKAFFDEMSKKYANYSNVIYEICNEPNGEVSWEEIKKYAEQVIAVIRKNDTKNIILVGTPNWSQFVDRVTPITGFENIMYTLHFYAGTHKQYLRDTLKKAVENGLPVFVSEYGICDASGNGNIDIAQANEWIRCMNGYNISYVAWNLSNKAESSALLKSDCYKKSGFTSNDFSDSGKWLYEMLSNNKMPLTVSQEPTKTEAVKNQNIKSIKLVNHWQEGTKQYYQYQVIVKHQNQWNISLNFNGNVTLVNGWNGIFYTNGNNITISCTDYNSSGNQDVDIGFIVDKEISLK